MAQIIEWTLLFMAATVLIGIALTVIAVLAHFFVSWDLARRAKRRKTP